MVGWIPIAALAWVLVAYLWGGILPAEWIVRRITGRIPEAWGDNPGGASTFRLAGWRAASLVILFDLIKGALPVIVADHIGWGTRWLVLSAVAPVAGHNWPAQRAFRPGGMGLAAALGAFLYLGWPGSVPAYVLGLLCVYLGRWAPWMGIVALPLTLTWMWLQGYPAARLWAAVGILVVLFVRQIPWLAQRVSSVAG